jgi:hypothetical protein
MLEGYNGNPNLKKTGTPVEWTPELVEEYAKCANNPIYFAERYIKIVHVDKGFIPIELYDYQRDIIEAVNEHRNVAVCTARQAGKTTVAAAIILHYILFNEYKTVALLANKGSAAIEILDRIKTAYEALPMWLQQGIITWNKGSIEIENGCKIIAAATSSSAIRGRSCVSGDTMICLEDDEENFYYTSIKEARKKFSKEKMKILTQDGFKKFDGFYDMGKKEIFLLQFDDTEIKCTSDHKFLRSDNTWVEASNMISGEIYNGHVFKTIINLNTKESVYDAINVENISSFIANGLIAHNCSFLYIDECSFVRGWEEFFSSVYPTISSGKETKLLLTSTPNGLNHFWKICKEAQENIDENGEGKNGYKYLEADWTQVPGRDEEWRQKTLASISFNEEQFAQEYGCSFVGSQSTLITGKVLKTLSSSEPLVKQENISQYEYAIKGRQYVMLVDTSKGKGLDYSAFSVIDVSQMPYKQVCTFRDNYTSPVDYASIIYRVAKLYNNAYVLIELNNGGSQIADLLFLDYGYEELLYTEKKDNKQTISDGFGSNVERGITTSVSTKNIGCSMLKLLIEQQQIILNDFNTINELSRFSKKGKSYEAEQGAHDDMVMTLVIFAWLVSQQYFKDLTDINTIIRLRDKTEEEIEEDLLPFGFIEEGHSEDTILDFGGF